MPRMKCYTGPSLDAATILAQQDPEFRDKFVTERREWVRRRRELFRKRNLEPCNVSARRRYRQSEKGKAARARAEAKRRARRRYGDTLGALF